MKNIIVMMMCFMALFSCTKDEEFQTKKAVVDESVQGTWILKSVTDGVTTFEFPYVESDFYFIANIIDYNGLDVFLDIESKNTIVFEHYVMEWVDGDKFVGDCYYQKMIENISIFNDDCINRKVMETMLDEYYRDYCIYDSVMDKWYYSYITIYNEIIPAEKGVERTSPNYLDKLYFDDFLDLKREEVSELTKMHKDFLDTCIPTSLNSGHFTQSGDTLKIKLNCTGGERTFTFSRER